ncbi:MAG: N-acetylmuramic acid 6-phosphate etherase [Firmicutes bacterium]|nr:N-acetylmuramic acid 6-phosphate etherase [Bacillota bacterium]
MEDWERLATEHRNAASYALDTMGTEELLRLMNDEDAKVAPAVAAVIPAVAVAVEMAVEALRAGGRLIYVGAGTSGRVGALDAAECVPTFGVSPETVQAVIAGGEAALSSPIEEAEDRAEAGAADLAARAVGPGDLVVGITASGLTPYVLGALRLAREAGARTVLLTCNDCPEAADYADVVIAPVVGPEVLTGSTRLKAGTAQKMVLNMISTATMVRLGKVYQNLMVDMKPTNKKLQARAVRIVQAATGCGEKEAAAALPAAGNEIKTAIVMIHKACDPATARKILAEVGGFVRRAIAGEGKP